MAGFEVIIYGRFWVITEGEAIAGTQGFRKLIEMSMPVPTDTVLGKLGRGEFHRISVAHGLSFPALNLAKTLGKEEVSP